MKVVKKENLFFVKNRILNFLNIQSYSRKELFEKALAKDFSPDIIEEALSQLEISGIVDDRKLTNQLIEKEFRACPCGKGWLRGKLSKRGIPAHIFEAVLDDFYLKQPQNKLVRQMIAKYLPRHKHLSPQKRTEKLIRQLRRKAFDWEVIRQVLHEQQLLNLSED